MTGSCIAMRPTIVIIVSFIHYTLVAKLTLASVAFMRQDVNQNTVPFPREVQRECFACLINQCQSPDLPNA